MDFPPASAGLPERRTVVLAGHDAGPVAEAFARAHGLPLLAEPSSNARFGPNAVGPYRLLLEHFGPESAQPIERVVLFGRPTLSRPVCALLARADVPSALYQPVPVAWYEPGRRTELPLDKPGRPRRIRRPRPVGVAGCLAAGRGRRAAALDRRPRRPTPAATGPSVGALVWEHSRGQLVLGSSNGIRDVDLAGLPAPEPAATVFANRGLSGIDGTIATATGIALGGRQETTLLLGDVTFLHDAGGLLLGAGEDEPSLRIVVLNDSGGAIFGLLEHGAVRARDATGRRRTPLRHPPHRGPRGTRRSVRRRACSVSTTAELARRCRAVGGPQHHRGAHGPARAAGPARAHQGRRGRSRGGSPRRAVARAVSAAVRTSAARIRGAHVRKRREIVADSVAPQRWMR